MEFRVTRAWISLVAWLAVLGTGSAAAGPAAPRQVCSRTQLICLLSSGVLNCSREGSLAASVAPGSEVARFTRDSSGAISVTLPSEAQSLALLNVSSLDGLVPCFLLSYTAALHLVSRSTAVQFLPRAFNAFGGIRRLTLRLRLAGDRIPAGVFTSRLASLVNLQLESPAISEIQAGAFEELRGLTRLCIMNLRTSRLSTAALRGLSELRVLELPDNQLTNLDGVAFSATPNLETVDMRTRASRPLSFAADTFCALLQLQEIRYSASLRALTCAHFASNELRLTSNRGRREQTVKCIRRQGERALCGEAAVTAKLATEPRRSTTANPTTKTTSSPSSTNPTSAPTTSASTAVIVTSTPPTTSAATSITSPPAKLEAVSAVPKPEATAGSQRRASAADPQVRARSADPAAVAVGVVAVALVLAGAGVATYLAARGRRGSGGGGGLRRAQSRQPIFSRDGGDGFGDCELSGSIDMQDSTWNSVYRDSEPAGTEETARQ